MNTGSKFTLKHLVKNRLRQFVVEQNFHSVHCVKFYIRIIKS